MSDLERVARLETRTDEQERRLQRIEIKLDQLLEMAAIGKGAGWLLIKAGAALAAAARKESSRARRIDSRRVVPASRVDGLSERGRPWSG